MTLCRVTGPGANTARAMTTLNVAPAMIQAVASRYRSITDGCRNRSIVAITTSATATSKAVTAMALPDTMKIPTTIISPAPMAKWCAPRTPTACSGPTTNMRNARAIVRAVNARPWSRPWISQKRSRFVVMAVFPYRRNIRRSLLFLLGREIERIALGAAHLGCLFRLCLRDIAGIDRNHAGALLMRRHHHLVGMALVHPEDRLEDQHDEFTRREIIVKQDHLPQRRPLRLRFDLYARLLKRLLAHGEPPAPASRRTCYFAAGAAPIPSNFASISGRRLCGRPVL